MNARVIETIEELEAFMGTVDDALAVPRDAGEFMHAMILCAGARRGLEIGTSYGYSGLWIASALAEEGGTLTTIDHDQRKIDAARGNFERAGLSDHVRFKLGRALDVLPSLHGPFDFVLNDADKQHCVAYVERLVDQLADRAIVLTDNTRTHPQELEAFVRWVRARPDFCSVDVPVGNGMELSVKRASR